MTDLHRTQWLAGHWIPVRPTASLTFRVRRQVRGRVEEVSDKYRTEQVAQQRADFLNLLEEDRKEQA